MYSYSIHTYICLRRTANSGRGGPFRDAIRVTGGGGLCAPRQAAAFSDCFGGAFFFLFFSNTSLPAGIGYKEDSFTYLEGRSPNLTFTEHGGRQSNSSNIFLLCLFL